MYEKKVLAQGICRKGNRDLPSEVIQQDIQGKNKQQEVRGIVKAPVFKEDDDCPNLVAPSVYDTRTIRFLSMMCDEIKLIKKTRNIFNVDSGEVKTL